MTPDPEDIESERWMDAGTMFSSALIKVGYPLKDLPLMRRNLPTVRLVSLRQGAVFIKEEDAEETAYLIQKGKVKVYRNGAAGTERVVAEVGNGSIVGEMALVTRSKRSATVESLEPLELFVLTARDFSLLLQGSPGFRDTMRALVLKRQSVLSGL